MKKQLLNYTAFLLTGAIALFSISCKEETEKPELSVMPPATIVVFAANGIDATSNGEAINPTFRVVTNQSQWGYTCDKNWVKIMKSSNEFTLSADPAGITPQEEAKVTITAGDATPVIIRVQQTPLIASLEVAPADRTLSFPSSGGTTASLENGENVTATFTVNSNVDWDVVSNKEGEWLHVTKTTAGFSLTADPNESTDERAATVTVTAGGITITIQVSQQGKTEPTNAFVPKPWVAWNDFVPYDIVIGLWDWLQTERIWDNNTEGFYNRYLSRPDGEGWSFTFDLKVVVKLSEVAIYPYIDDHNNAEEHVYNQVQILEFEMWGIKVLDESKIDGDPSYWLHPISAAALGKTLPNRTFMDDWVYLGRHKVPRLDLEGASNEEILQQGLNGHHFEISPECEPVRYIRFFPLAVKNHAPPPNNYWQLAELSFWGDMSVPQN